MATSMKAQKSPDFLLEGSDGRLQSLTDYRGRTVILYFYPKAETAR